MKRPAKNSITSVAEEKKICYNQRQGKGQEVVIMSVKVDIKMDEQSMSDFMV